MKKRRFAKPKTKQDPMPLRKCDRTNKKKGSKEGHVQQIEEAQDGLDNLIKLWNANNCGDLPPGVEEALDSNNYPTFGFGRR
jgi:hypothetical protein